MTWLGWAGPGPAVEFSNHQRDMARWPVSAPAPLSLGLIIVNAWYGKFVNDKSRKNEKVKVIDVTVPLQCLVKDSKLILTEASKVQHQVTSATCSQASRTSSSLPGVCTSSVCWAQKSSAAVSGGLQARLRKRLEDHQPGTP